MLFGRKSTIPLDALLSSEYALRVDEAKYHTTHVERLKRSWDIVRKQQAKQAELMISRTSNRKVVEYDLGTFAYFIARR